MQPSFVNLSSYTPMNVKWQENTQLTKTLNIQSSMRNNTQRIYERLIRGEFLSVDSSDNSIRHLYDDLEENFEDYTDYFKEVGLQLEQGNGYFYFSRIGEGKQAIEQKLESFSKWLDYLDFLKYLSSG